MCSQVRIESDPKEWPAQAAQLAAQRQQHEALQASVRRVNPACMLLFTQARTMNAKMAITSIVQSVRLCITPTLFHQAYQPCWKYARQIIHIC